MICEHAKIEDIKAAKELAGLTFIYEAKRCLLCGSVLWSQDTEEQFQIWLDEQREKNPDSFVIKVTLPSSLVNFAIELALANHSTEFAVYQACLDLYFSNATFEQKDLEAGFKGELLQKEFRVSPKIFVALNSNARLFGFTLGTVASWVILNCFKTIQAYCPACSRSRGD